MSRCASISCVLPGRLAVPAVWPGAKLFQKPGYFRARLHAESLGRATTQFHHDIHSLQTVTQPAENIPHQSLGAVAIHRSRRYPLAGNDAYAR